MSLQILSIIVPCYDEEDGLPEFVRQFEPVRAALAFEYKVDVTIADEGSKDQTAAILHQRYDGTPGTRML